MMEYVNAVKRGFRDQHGFVPTGGTDTEPLFEDVIPDGDYPMDINGRRDNVKVEGGKLSFCNFD